MCDHFTRFAQTYATKSKSSRAAADKLFNNFILHFGFPKRIHHDKGSEFNSNLFHHLHRLAGIRASNTTPYHPQGDGQVERYNRTLINMLKSIPENEKTKWKDHLAKLTFAYNSTVHKSTGYSPFFLMFGRESRLPIDGIFPTKELGPDSESYGVFVNQWKDRMNEAYKLAAHHSQKSASYNKKHYDAKARSVDIEVGDRVLVQNVRKRGEGKRKLLSYWEPEVYVVVEKKNDLPVYVIRPHSQKTSKTRTIHRNLLKLVNELRPPEIESVIPVRSKTKSSAVIPVRSKTKSSAVKEPESTRDTTSDSSDSDDSVIIVEREIVTEEFQESPIEEDVQSSATSSDVDVNVSENDIVEDADDVPSDSPNVSSDSVDDDSSEDQEDEEEDESDEDEVQNRVSSRNRRAPEVFTYDTVGGNPKYVRR